MLEMAKTFRFKPDSNKDFDKKAEHRQVYEQFSAKLEKSF